MPQRWFKITPETDGDRELGEQMRGLGPLLTKVRGHTVLDVGCAEGLISLALAERGAQLVHGIEIRADHVEVAKSMVTDATCVAKFEAADADTWWPYRHFDIVLLLAVLHKLREPADAARRFGLAARKMVVVRLPPEFAPWVWDKRSGNVAYNIEAALADVGLYLTEEVTGPRDEWTGYFRREA